MDAISIKDLRVGDRVLYNDAGRGQLKARVEDISHKSGVPTVLLGTDDECIAVGCVWCLPGVTLLGKGPRGDH